MKKRNLKRKDIQEKKRQEAETRAEDRAKRTDGQQLARLDAAGHTATKERAKLRARIDRTKRIKKGVTDGSREDNKV